MSLLLMMETDTLEDVPPIRLPSGYRLRTASALDRPAVMWARVVNRSFADNEWTAEYVTDEFIGKPQYDPDGVFFVFADDAAVSTAFAWLDAPCENCRGRVHWVGTVQEHRRHGLARVVVTAVLKYFAGRGFRKAFLETEPERLPAIQLYLSLGFRPRPRNEKEAAAWSEVMQQLQQ